MLGGQVYFYSPFSSTTVADNNNPSLILLLILKELVKNPHGLTEGPAPLHTPFDWAFKSPSAPKVREHLSLMPIAFPALASHIPSLFQNLHRPAREVVLLLEPFILACESNENLLLFLIRHQNELAVKPILDKICPEGLNLLKERIAVRFRQRGYHFTRWTHSSKTL